MTEGMNGLGGNSESEKGKPELENSNCEPGGQFEEMLKIPVVKPWPEPVDGCVLLDQIAWTLNLFVILPEWAAETLALWILHTYAFQLRDVTAYIGLESPEHRCDLLRQRNAQLVAEGIDECDRIGFPVHAPRHRSCIPASRI